MSLYLKNIHGFHEVFVALVLNNAINGWKSRAEGLSLPSKRHINYITSRKPPMAPELKMDSVDISLSLLIKASMA